MRKYLILLLIIFCANGFCQVTAEPAPAVASEKNWVSSIRYDLSGSPIAKAVSYFDTSGMIIQSQDWDILSGRIWNSETKYDYFGRPAFQALSAPVGNSFGYAPNFIMFGSAPLVTGSWDNASNLFSPPMIFSGALNTLGWYYSPANTYNSYQDVTFYPYQRVVYSELNPGSVRAILGGDKISIGGGIPEWLQTYTFSMPMEIPVDPNDPFYEAYTGKRITKTVNRDVHGIETVSFVSSEGDMVGSARSGLGGTAVREVFSKILDQDYVDVHIAEGCGGMVLIENANTNHLIRIYNLITEQIISTANPITSINLEPGFYRFEDVYKYYGKNSTTISGLLPVQIRYSTNYYDLALNKFDYAGRLLQSTQPIGLQSSFTYNTLGELTSAVDPDTGLSKFKYRLDGQIRFSENVEQQKINAFSYTNYDNLARPIESGVYTGGFGVFMTSDNIVDLPDGLPLTGRTEQNFIKYDEPDVELAGKLQGCGIPSAEYLQTFIAGNVSFTYNQNPFTTKTWYSYDLYGRLKWIVQEIPGLNCLKTTDYEYDPINGNLLFVKYQKHNSLEAFFHKYLYDQAGQLTDVFTKAGTGIYVKQAHYIYDDAKNLVRTELGSNLQGIDYVYNIAGKLKAINHPSLSAIDDPGNDGANGFPSDVFGMALDYYDGDYSRQYTPKPITTTLQGVNQYNGNLKATRWNTQVPSLQQNAYTYQYNKNNWLTNSTYGTATSAGVFTPNVNQDYEESDINYDANGNITSISRNGYTDASGTAGMDEFEYFYEGNRLKYVKDLGDNSDVIRYSDLKDQEVLTPTGAMWNGNPVMVAHDNYVYNDLGQLKANLQESISYEYNSSGLVTKIKELSPVNTGDFITLEYETYPTLIDIRNRWGMYSELMTQVMLCPLMEFDDEDPILPLSGYFVRLSGTGTKSTKIRVTPNTFLKLDLDLMVDKKLWDGDFNYGNPSVGTVGAEIIPQVIFNVKTPDGTIIYTTTVLNQPATFCEQFFTQHLSMQFTSGIEEFVTLEFVITNNDSGLPGDQRVFVDNIQLQAAENTRVAFSYNERNQRVMKQNFLVGGTTANTYYVRDLSGNVMAIYSLDLGAAAAGQYKVNEHAIYGIGRVGVFKRNNGIKLRGSALYELTDHLGNVRAVIRKAGVGVVAVTSKTDYYPFGMPMPNKHITDGNYRYAFQGQEKDPETNMEAFELRLWDSRIGRWLTIDPMGQHFSPYSGMGNNPVSHIDVDGGWETWLGAFCGWVAGGFEGHIFKSSTLGDYGIQTQSGFDSGDGSVGIMVHKDFGGERFNKTGFGMQAEIRQMSSFESGFMDFERWRRDDKSNLLLHMGAELTYGTADNVVIFLTGFGTNRRGISGETYDGDRGAGNALDGFITLATAGVGTVTKSSNELLKSTPKLWNSFQRMHIKPATRTEVSQAYKEMLLKNHNQFYINKNFERFNTFYGRIDESGKVNDHLKK